MYPEVNVTGVTYGVVLTQTCDLVLDKQGNARIPYINIALAEPIDRYIDDEYAQRLKAIYEKHSLNFSPNDRNKYIFINHEPVVDMLVKDFTGLFQNNAKYFYFMELPRLTKNRMYVLNLTKVFPLKSRHSKVLVKNLNIN